jgi:transglutaminase/protease-like cytokinesis protein 3
LLAPNREHRRDILDEAVEGLPEGAGQRDALEYFIGWTNDHLNYDNEALNKVYEFSTEDNATINDAYRYYTIPSSLACVVEGKAMCVGFSKVLVYLCNSVGIEAKVVTGNIKGGWAHAIAAVTIEGKTAYFDISGIWDYQKGTKKALGLSEIKKRMNLHDYFTITED